MAKLSTAGSLSTTDSTVEMGTANAAQVGVNVTGTWTGTITFEARRGSTWENAAVFTVANPPVAAAATTTANVSRRIDTGGTSAVRARFSTASSGAPVVQFDGTEAGMGGSSSGGGGGAVTVADGADVALGTTTDAAIITSIAGTVIGFLRGSIVQWAAFLARFPAALISGRLDVNLGAAPAVVTTIGGQPATPTCTFTRPANTTAYTIGDEVGTAGTAPTTVSVARANGLGGIIQGAQVFYSGYPAITPQLTLMVFSATVTLAGDNAQFSLSDTDAAKLVCRIPLTSTQTSQYSAGAAVSAGGVWLSGAPDRPAPHFICGGSETTLYCCLVTGVAFTPIANSEVLTVVIDVEQN